MPTHVTLTATEEDGTIWQQREGTMQPRVRHLQDDGTNREQRNHCMVKYIPTLGKLGGIKDEG
jgi:hypothetical protein